MLNCTYQNNFKKQMCNIEMYIYKYIHILLTHQLKRSNNGSNNYPKFGI